MTSPTTPAELMAAQKEITALIDRIHAGSLNAWDAILTRESELQKQIAALPAEQRGEWVMVPREPPAQIRDYLRRNMEVTSKVQQAYIWQALIDLAVDAAKSAAPQAEVRQGEEQHLGGCAAEPGSEPVWRHKKRGTLYKEIARGCVQIATNLQDGDGVIVYRGDDGKWWVRSTDEFLDGRFDRVDAPPPSHPAGGGHDKRAP